MGTHYQKAAAKKAESLRVREIGEGADPSEPPLPLKRNQRHGRDPYAQLNYARVVVLRRLGVTVYRRESSYVVQGRTLASATFHREGRLLLETIARRKGISPTELAAMVAQAKNWQEAFPITRKPSPRAPRPRA